MGFYDFGADASAVRVLKSALEFAPDAEIANTVAWILATTEDAALRDGRLALSMVEPLLQAAPDDPSVLSTFAAACAEVGRFADAVRGAERALAVVRQSGDRAAEPLLQRRLEAYRAGQPWRQ
jgi:Flp pilus assembly protein TadD